jgi:hypothetical protein
MCVYCVIVNAPPNWQRVAEIGVGYRLVLFVELLCKYCVVGVEMPILTICSYTIYGV